MIKIFEVVTKWIDKNRAIDVAYMDLGKAFDKFQHGRTVWKVTFGILGQPAD